MTDEAKLRVAALRWAHLHEDCNDADDTCPVQDECSRCPTVLCGLRTAANLIESLSAELEQVKRERDAAVEDVRLAVCDDLKCSTCMYKGNESHMCDDCDVHTFCNWQWRGMKEEPHD